MMTMVTPADRSHGCLACIPCNDYADQSGRLNDLALIRNGQVNDKNGRLKAAGVVAWCKQLHARPAETNAAHQGR